MTSQDLKTACEQLGHSAFVVPLSQQFPKRADEMGAQLVICDLKDDFSGLRAAKDAIRWFKLPAIVVSDTNDDIVTRKVAATKVSGCLFQPVASEGLRLTIVMAMTRHYRETERLAQGILMGQARLTEDESYRLLQEDASKTGRTLYDQANLVIEEAEDRARRRENELEEPWNGTKRAADRSGRGQTDSRTSGKS